MSTAGPRGAGSATPRLVDPQRHHLTALDRRHLLALWACRLTRCSSQSARRRYALEREGSEGTLTISYSETDSRGRTVGKVYRVPVTSAPPAPPVPPCAAPAKGVER